MPINNMSARDPSLISLIVASFVRDPVVFTPKDKRVLQENETAQQTFYSENEISEA